MFADRLDDEASPIQPDDSIDLSDVVHDEVALALPWRRCAGPTARDFAPLAEPT